MEKLDSTFKNMFLSLFLIAGVAAAALASVYNATKEPIAKAKSEKQTNAIKMVAPLFDNNPAAEMVVISQDGMNINVFPAKMNGRLVGAAIESITNRGFSGEIRIMVGIDSVGTILNYSVLEHHETPGLGSKMELWFRNGKGNILGKNGSISKFKVSKDGGAVDAITAATISSRAFLDAVERADVCFRKLKENN